MSDLHPAHFPANPAKFEFDGEVSKIFPSMAENAIPMYLEAHRLHVSLLRDILDTSIPVTIVDIGASRGHFFKEICNQLQIDVATGVPNWSMIAVDSSRYMMEYLHDEMPCVTAIVADAVDMPDLPVPADVISMFYVLQFIEDEQDRMKLLRWAYRNLRPGGRLLLGQKEKVFGELDGMFTEEYYRFRERNGYTRAEIEAKTAALKNSMWPISPEWLESMCYEAKFNTYAETTKWLQFSTSMAIK